ncbi:Stk1 family PASTA domain-containing Ser/Thr kinase [Salinifilum aidingensis]
MASEEDSGRNGSASLLGSLLEGRYRVDEVLARGGMSTVYTGVDTRLDRPVAIKVMDSQHSGDRSFVERFEREARTAARLDHPNIVAVYDQGVDRSPAGDHVFLVMQLVRGCTLRDLIQQHGRLSLPVALSVLEPVLSALGAAHQAGMVHRDVKPENVLIGTDGTVHVADFGLVRAAASAGTTSGGVILGTVAYLSPEQVTTGDADPRSDVYAAGVVLHEMLTGQPPYVADNALSVAYRHVNEDMPPPGEQLPDLPPAVDALAVRATRRDAAERPADAEAFRTELVRLRQDLGIAPVPVPVPTDAERTERMTPAGPPLRETRAYHPGAADSPGPRGTRALSRPAQEVGADAADTREIAAVETGRRRWRRSGLLWALGVLVLVGLLGAGAFYLGARQQVDVPHVAGQPEQQATTALREAGLQPEVTREHNDDTAEGLVLRTSPEAGSRASEGGSVRVVVSLGKPQVPEIAPGTSVTDAESALRDAQLRPQRAGEEYHRTVPEGHVIRVDPQPGTRLPSSAQVQLVVSRGPRPVPVPDVSGAAQQEAFQALQQAGFTPYVAGEEFNGDVAGGHVIRTDPEGGTTVQQSGEARVGVVVSNAVSVPNFNGKSVQQAQQMAAEAGLQLKVRSLFDREGGLVLGQLPMAGQRVEPGSTVSVNAF